MQAVDLVVKALVGAACIAIVAYVGLSVFAYNKAVTTVRAYSAAAVEQARSSGECSRARSLVERYKRGGKQQPGMMSWDEARRLIETRCEPARNGPRAGTMAASAFVERP